MSIYNSYSYSLKERELNFINRLLEEAPTFEYVGGYKNSESKVLLKCKICGTYKEITAQCIRKGHRNIICNSCLDYMKYLDREKKDRVKKINNLIDNYNNHQRKTAKELYDNLKSKTTIIKHCRVCGKEIFTKYSYQKLCSKCARKEYSKNHSNKSLKELYKRDKGICYICGGKCDYEDYTFNGNTFIAGNYYPSIDHVIPLIKGGNDNWDNLKLAHRICNSLKSINERA